MTQIYYRVSGRTNQIRRPEWYSSYESALNCVRIFGRREETRLTLISDGTCTDRRVLDLPWAEVLTVPADSNAAAFMAAYDVALELPDWEYVYLLEEDYYHRNGALEALLCARRELPSSYVTLYDDPLYYWRSSDVTPSKGYELSIVATTRGHWRTAPSTTMTFAAPVWMLRRDRVVFDSELRGYSRPPDQRVWERLLADGEVLWSPLPGLSTHVETTALAPYADWRQYGSPARIENGDRMVPPRSLSVTPSELFDGAARSRLTKLFKHVKPAQSLSTIAYEAEVAAVSAEEKYELDALTSDSATSVHYVIVDDVIKEVTGRWFSGRDWLLSDLETARTERFE